MPKWKDDGEGTVFLSPGRKLILRSRSIAGHFTDAHNADIDALTEEIQQFRDAYVHDREIMADNVAQLGSYEARIDALTAERDELQRRLAEVVVKISEAVVSDDDCVCSMLCHSAITAIAEGRDNG